MVSALSEHKDFAAILERSSNLSGNHGRSIGVVGQVAEYVLDARSLRQNNLFVEQSRDNLQFLGLALWLGGSVPNSSALHENDRLLTVATDRCRG